MEITLRQNEQKILESALKKEQSQFFVMYGRRRIGKTYLIRSTFQKHLVFECSGLYLGEKEQLLENFWVKLSNQSGTTIKPPKTWIQAFNQLEAYLNSLENTKKKVIFLDEISWFDTPKAGFLGALSNFWNSYCTKRTDIVLIICGSAASWIIDKVVNDKGGLHNRLNRTIKLNAFTLAETRQFFQAKKIKLSDKDIIQLYMCVGGVPFYLNEVESGKSVAQILEELFFKENALLHNEFENLYAALFKNHENHVTVIKALSTKNRGLTRSEITEITKLPSGGALSIVLEELEQCGFIGKFTDYDKPKADGLYRLLDEYTIFYQKFIRNKPNQNAQELVASQAFKIWSGFAFETLCFKHLPQIANALGISGINYNCYSFVDKGRENSDGSQIDMVIDRADNCINILEMKYYNDTYVLTKKETESLNRRVNSFLQKTKTKKSVFVTLVTVHGAEKNEQFLSLVTNEIRAEALMLK